MATAVVKTASIVERNRLVVEFLPLVKAIATNLHKNLPPTVEWDDLVHAGVFGLMAAAEKYDTSQEASFPTYAKHRIRGAMIDSLRQLDFVSRDARRQARRVDQAAQELTGILQRDPTESEVAEWLQIDISELQRRKQQVQQAMPISTTVRNDDGAEQAVDLPSSPEFDPGNLAAQQEARDKLNRALRALPVRYQEVVLYYYKDQLTMKEIGERMGVNESRVSQIHKSALAKLETALSAEGIGSFRDLTL